DAGTIQLAARRGTQGSHAPPSPDLLFRDMKTSHRLGIPAFALGRGLSEAGFVLTVKAGLTGHDSPLLLAAIPLLVLLRFVFQDRGAILEAAALRDGV